MPLDARLTSLLMAKRVALDSTTSHWLSTPVRPESSAAARMLIDRGHSVKSVALPPLPEGLTKGTTPEEIPSESAKDKRSDAN